jgi:hypothetical protein
LTFLWARATSFLLPYVQPTTPRVCFPIPTLDTSHRPPPRVDTHPTGLATDPIQIKSIKVSPDPPQPGQNLTVEVEADVINKIDEGAYADVTVKLGLVKLLQKQFDVCEEA